MKTFAKFSVSTVPFVTVGVLLYAALWIKPQAAGSSVAPPAIARGDFIYGITQPVGDSLLAAGSEGKVWRGSLGGPAWTLLPTPTKVNLQDIAAWDSRHAVAVGNDGVVIVSDDGGNSWRQVDAPKSGVANKLMRVRTAGASEAWAVGEMGAVLHTKDFGATWVRAAAEVDAAWNDVHAHAGKVWLVGEFGRIAYSADGGGNWKAVASPVKASLMAIAYRDAA
ncbi:MAG: WD40/YVTN/BNR-like repeat-containing protein, partial [Noviherbaspirillum sp.]